MTWSSLHKTETGVPVWNSWALCTQQTHMCMGPELDGLPVSDPIVPTLLKLRHVLSLIKPHGLSGEVW